MTDTTHARPGPIGWGIRFLTWFAGLRFVEKWKFEKPAARMLRHSARVGFRVEGAVNRQFKAVRRLTSPSRLNRTGQQELFDVTPTDEQGMIRESMARFAGEAMRSAAAQADAEAQAPDTLREAAADLGLAMLSVPESLGGAAAERSPVTSALIAEALAHGDMGLAVAFLAPAGVATALAEWGDADQQSKYLPSFAGERPPVAALALLEDGALFDPLVPGTEARRGGDGYELDGAKTLVPGAAKAELFLVAARTESGPAVFIVESGSHGLSVEPQPAMGIRGAATGRVLFEKVKLPATARLGGEQDAAYQNLLDFSRLAWCALAVGTAQAVLDYVVPYANERIAFGEPISHRQGVAFMVSNIGIELEAMRLATWRAAALAAAGKPFTRETALARQMCGRGGMQIGSDGVQILGGHGYVKEHPVERWYRDLRAVALMEGGVIL